MHKIVIVLAALTAFVSAEPAWAGLEDPYPYWLIGQSVDGSESLYLRKDTYSKDPDTGMTTAYMVAVSIGDRVKDFEYATWMETEFNCANHTFGPRYNAVFDVEGTQHGVTIIPQEDITFQAVTTGESFDIVYGVVCGTMDPGALPVADNKTVTQLIDDQFTTYGKVYAATHGTAQK